MCKYVRINVKSRYDNDISEIKSLTFTNTKVITFTNLEVKCVTFTKLKVIDIQKYTFAFRKIRDENATYTSVKKQVTFRNLQMFYGKSE